MIPLCDSSRQLMSEVKFLKGDFIELRWVEATKAEHVDHWQLFCSYSDQYTSHLRLRASAEVLERVESLPGVSPVKSDPCLYNAPNSLLTQSLVRSFISQGLKVTVADERARLEWSKLCNLADAYDRCAKRVADWKLSRVLPQEAWDLEVHPTRPPMDHQRLGVLNVLEEVPGYGLWFKMGVGKTPTAVIAVCNLALRREDKSTPLRVLTVCPNKVRENWAEEFKAFNTRAGKVTISRGSAYERMATVASGINNTGGNLDYTTIIVGTDTLACSQELYGMIPWDLIIVDESHDFCTTSTERWKALRQIRLSAKKKISLTGTPQRNTPLELFSQFELFDPGMSGFRDQKTFKKFYGKFYKGEGGIDVEDGVKNLPYLKEHVARLTMIVDKKEVLADLPEKVFDVVEVELTARQKDVYLSVSTQLALEIEKDLAGVTEASRSMVIQNVLVKLLRLSQITGGFLNWPEELDPDTGEVLQPKKLEYFANSPKIQALCELLLDPEKTEKDKSIVWCNHLAEIDWVSSALTHFGVKHVVYTGEVPEDERRRREVQYNTDPATRVFVGNQLTGGTGLNLLGYDPKAENPIDCNTTHIITLSRPWSAVLCEQSIDRGHRKGTRARVRVTDIVVPRSIDTVMRDSVIKKIEGAIEVQDLTSMLSALNSPNKE